MTTLPRVHFGVIGASGIADRRTMPAFKQTECCELIAVCSRSQDRARTLAAGYGAKHAFNNIESLLSCDEVQAVYVASPVHLHLEHAKAVARAGKHLLLEKPLARTVAEAKQLLAFVEHARIFAAEGYMMKFHPAHLDIRNRVHANQFGRIIYARARLGCWYPESPCAWRQDPQLGGGGALIDIGSHLLDLLIWILGPIENITALCNTQAFRYESEDSATALVQFCCGTHGVIESYFSLPDALGVGELELLGTRGGVKASGTIGQSSGGTVEWRLEAGQMAYNAQQETSRGEFHAKSQTYEKTDLYAAELDYFARCILENRAPEINQLQDGLEVMRWIERAYKTVNMS